MKRAPVRIVGILAGVAVTAAVVFALRPPPLTVEVAPAARGPLAASVTAEGRARVKALYVVGTPVDGELERIALEPGDAVRPGDVVARIWPIAPRPLDVRSRAEAIAAVAASRAAVARAEATQKEAAGALTHAESRLQTARTLVAGEVAAQKELEHSQHEVDIRRQAVDAARAAVQVARAELEHAEAVVATRANQAARPALVVASPAAGRVLRVLRESAGSVTAGTPLIEIGDTSAIEVVADVLTADAMAVRAGAAATIRDWGSPRPIAATVRRIDPAAFTKVSALGLEEQRVRVVLDLAEPPPEGFGHDFHVTASIVVWSGESVLAVPSTALFRSGDRWAVFAIQNSRARLKHVTPGPSDGARTAVEQGLAEGEAVVTQPSDLLRDGARVEGVPPASATSR